MWRLVLGAGSQLEVRLNSGSGCGGMAACPGGSQKYMDIDHAGWLV